MGRTKWLTTVQAYVTDIDFQEAHLPRETIRILGEVMPIAPVLGNGGASMVNGSGKQYDCEWRGRLAADARRKLMVVCRSCVLGEDVCEGVNGGPLRCR